MSSQSSLRIGIDFGGVCQVDDVETKEVDINVPDCVETLQLLKSQGHTLILISFCGKSRANHIRQSVPLDKYFDEIYFVKDRKYKANLCDLRNVDGMIDDRLDILETIKGCETIHFGSHPSDLECKYLADHNVTGWLEVASLIPSLTKKKQCEIINEVPKKMIYL